MRKRTQNQSRRRSPRRSCHAEKPSPPNNHSSAMMNPTITCKIKRSTTLRNRRVPNGRNNRRWMKSRSLRRPGSRSFRNRLLPSVSRYMAWCLTKNRSLWSVRMTQGRHSGSSLLLFWHFIIASLYHLSSVSSLRSWVEYSFWYSIPWLIFSLESISSSNSEQPSIIQSLALRSQIWKSSETTISKADLLLILCQQFRLKTYFSYLLVKKIRFWHFSVFWSCFV